MSGWYEKNYWRTGFKSSLYDRLTPESYFESMRQTVALLPEKVEQKIWDAGCGSGLLLEFLGTTFNRDMNYIGSDLLSVGLEQVKQRARELGVLDHVACFQNDLTETPPLKENSLDVVIAHFSIYTIRDDDKRQQALKNMLYVLKPDGLLIICCPSTDYDADQIIKESLALVKVKRGLWNVLLKRLIFYPFTKILGLNFIQKQLKSDKWKAYTVEELSGELQRAGFKTGVTKTVYAGSAYLMCGHKKS